MKNFKFGNIKVIIATDIAARGLDVKDIKLVLNYDMPQNLESYVHRIGRTGRAGETGLSISFFTDDDFKMAKPLIDFLKESKQSIPSELYDYYRD